MPLLHVRHEPWPRPERSAPLPHPEEAARGLSATDRTFRRDGVPVIPVSGEIHYSRTPRARWAERLRQLRAGGITIASTYVFWNHHVRADDTTSFSGQLDLAAFVDEVAAAGLDLVLRIGPWVHGEARNGGFPDPVQWADVVHRSDDPAYLTLVREWFGALARALDGRARPGGPVIGIQVENELYDRPQHLSTLITLAREAGMSAPLWTATAWGGAQLPAGEVVPLFGGYADGFWVDPDGGWQPNFRAHFFPSHDWDDPGVGDDVRGRLGFAPAADDISRAAELHGFPPATCELGSGMAAAYHRRPVLSARDVAALAHVKIGNGSGWQGYFMYAGGRNPGPGLQETQDTGYPNDLPSRGYDFGAPLSQAGDPRSSSALLRAQHAFLAAFGDRLGGMTSSLPAVRPAGLDDRSTLRWALRSDGREGFVVISHHQPYEGVETARGVRIAVELDDGTVTLPAEPVDIPAGTLARWPVGLALGSTRVHAVTASALTLLPPAPGAADPTLVVVADAGIPVEIRGEDEAPRVVTAGIHRVGGTAVLVLDDADEVWVRGQELYRTDGELAWDDETVLLRGASRLDRYDLARERWERLETGAPPARRAVPIQTTRAAGPVPADYGFGGSRHRAPSPAVFEDSAAVHALEIGDPGDDGVLEVAWAGDVAELRVDGVTVDDRFWDGERWTVSLADVGVTAASAVTLHVLPLSEESTVWLPPGAAGRRHAAARGTIESAFLRERGAWRPLRREIVGTRRG
ncbi:beta-galactosidase [Microbacterium sp. TNHR37B]|uniref:beta-galactosidase n=1 Tax=Microbacterium sp. TNHR37B TaxID=1775956 RepID=UPI0007B30145|nr:beta-galactosidase [Microbacterium sp. TNHR37B]KZE88578.1 Beta-galactosidase [Microbacterium sp. TNHR37B]